MAALFSAYLIVSDDTGMLILGNIYVINFLFLLLMASTGTLLIDEVLFTLS